jgi:hypothetical protein
VSRGLLDENLPRKLKTALEIEATTVPERGWGGIKNGPLLKLAEQEFDAFLTMDQGIAFQQRIAHLDLCVVVLVAPSNDIDDLLPLVPAVRQALVEAVPGSVIRIPA